MQASGEENWARGEKLSHSCIASGNVKQYNFSGNSLAVSYQSKHAITI